MKIDGSILVDDPHDAGPRAQALEASGYDGGFVFEGRHDPFLQLAVAAERSERIELMSAIAVAFARNPMTLANLGYDLQLHSKGRFVLGLGSQIKPHIERRYSMPWSKPASRMREMVQAIRAIWQSWETGEKLAFKGEFYTHDLMTPVFDPGPNPHGTPRIFVAGVGPLMTSVAAEVGDGYFLHPFHTARFVEENTLPALREGRDLAGKRLDDFEITAQVIVATGENQAELKAAMDGAKAQISLYGSTPAYRGVLESAGVGDLQQELNVLSKRGDWLEMVTKIDDDLLRKIAVVGTIDEIPVQLAERYGDWAQRISLVAYGGQDIDWPEIIHAL